MHMIWHYLQRHDCPFFLCTDPYDGLPHRFAEWFCKHFHPRFWNPNQMVVDIVHRMPCFPDLCDLNLRMFTKPEMFSAVNMRSILLQLFHNFPVRLCSCHNGSSHGCAATKKRRSL